MTGKDLSLVILYDIYSNLLSEKEKESFEYYYLDDLSLSEIAEIMHTSRQGARDNIVRAEKSLLNYEEKLGLKKKNEENDKNISLAISLLDEGKNEEAKRVLENTKF
jgi:predicted DNA-binding protein YlxM (UPF0122 family)